MVCCDEIASAPEAGRNTERIIADLGFGGSWVRGRNGGGIKEGAGAHARHPEPECTPGSECRQFDYLVQQLQFCFGLAGRPQLVRDCARTELPG